MEAEYCDDRVYVCVCVRLSAIMSSELHFRFPPCGFFVHGRDSVRFWRRSDVSYISGFTDYVVSQGCSTSLPAEAQCRRSLRLGYKMCAVIPPNQRTNGTTLRTLTVTSHVATRGRSLRSVTALFVRHYSGVHSGRTELTCNKLTQLHDTLLVTRASVTKFIGCSSRTAVQFSSVHEHVAEKKTAQIYREIFCV